MHPEYNYFLNLFWALTTFGAFIGYGRILARQRGWPVPGTHQWAWHALYGAAGILAIGGFLMAFSLAKSPVLIFLVLAGAGLWLLQVSNDLIKGNLFGDKAGFLKDLPLWVLMLVYVLAAVAWPHQIDPNDDLLLYFTMPVRILQEGTLLEPFSYRRAGTYGGHAFLQALMLGCGSERNCHLPDMGWARLMLFGLTASLLADVRRSAYWLYLVFMLSIFLLPVPRINTMSSLTGAVFVLAAIVYVSWYSPQVKRNAASFVPLSLLLLAATIMRPNFAAQAVGITILVACLGLIAAPQKEKRAYISYWAKCFGLLFVLLAPWMTVLVRSNGTVALPPFHGWINPAFLDMSSRAGFATDVKNALFFLGRFEVLGYFFGMIFFVWANPAGRVAWATAGATAALGLYLAYSCSIVIPSETFRYLFPMVLSGFLFIVGGWLNDQCKHPTPVYRNVQFYFLVPAVALIAWTQIPNGVRELFYNVISIPLEVRTRRPIVDGGREFYAQLQKTVPAGAKILAVVDFPYLLNYRRNTIYNIDAIGGSSLPPGMPYFQGSRAVRDYLVSLGIHHVMAVKFDRAVLMYTRRLWQRHNRPEWYFTEVWGTHALDLMDTLDWLHRTGTILFENESYRVFRIKS